jgi:hypothetical protein
MRSVVDRNVVLRRIPVMYEYVAIYGSGRHCSDIQETRCHLVNVR